MFDISVDLHKSVNGILIKTKYYKYIIMNTIN